MLNSRLDFFFMLNAQVIMMITMTQVSEIALMDVSVSLLLSMRRSVSSNMHGLVELLSDRRQQMNEQPSGVL
jgi:hypothetical protein